MVVDFRMVLVNAGRETPGPCWKTRACCVRRWRFGAKLDVEMLRLSNWANRVIFAAQKILRRKFAVLGKTGILTKKIFWILGNLLALPPNLPVWHSQADCSVAT